MELPTIKLKGKDYVQVKDRIIFFNETYPNGQITTKIVSVIDSKMVRFRATVQPDVSNPRKFVAHSFGTIDEVKAFEKLETVAVGRALALMGIGIVESIASADEMDRFNNKPQNTQTPIASPKAQTENSQKWSKEQVEEILAKGDWNIKTGVSKASNKAWYALDSFGQRGWISEETYKYLQNYSK